MGVLFAASVQEQRHVDKVRISVSGPNCKKGLGSTARPGVAGAVQELCSLQSSPAGAVSNVRHCRYLKYPRESRTTLNTLVCSQIKYKVSGFSVTYNYYNE